VSQERTRILFVPAELLAPEVGRTILGRGSLDVRFAADYRAALRDAAGWMPHLIVLRSEIDGHDAVDFCRAIHAQLREAPPKLLMLTERLRAAAQADVACDAHLVSPVSIDQLLATIAELLDLSMRGSDRAAIDALVHTEGFADDGTAVDATLSSGVNLSEDGMLIEAGRQLRIGARGKLQFFLPGITERLAVDARVRVAVDEVRLRYVVEFVDLPPQHRALIRRYVESQSVAA
jgi:CheY-like chemotaxis protein